jgi:hypothetical protein
MSGGGVGQGAVYSPLPQSISDTDSTEEELNNIVHHSDNIQFIVPNKDAIDKPNGMFLILHINCGLQNPHNFLNVSTA